MIKETPPDVSTPETVPAKQTKEQQLEAIDKFFDEPDKKVIVKKIVELKRNRKDFDDDPEFQAQIDTKVAQLEEIVTPITKGKKGDFKG